MDNDYIIQLITKLDGSKTADDLKKIEQQLNAKGINLKTSLDTATSKQQLQELTKQLQSVLKSSGLEIDTSKIMSAFSQVSKEADKLAQNVNKIQHSFKVGDYDTQLKGFETALKKAGIEGTELENKLSGVKTALSSLQESVNAEKIIPSEVETRFENLKTETKKLSNEIKNIKLDKSLVADNSKINDTITKLNEQLRKNSAYSSDAKKQIRAWIKELESGDVADARLKQINSEAKKLHANMAKLGKDGLNWWDKLKNAWEKFGGWSIATASFTFISSNVKKAVSELKDLDDILTEISKTSDLTEQQIKKLGNSSFDTASEFGKKASDYLSNVTEMYRAGFDNAEEMAQLSLLAQAAGDLDSSASDDYLLATNAAYNYKGSVEELNKVLDSQNYITNNAAVNMQDMSDATSEAASVASQYGVSIEELSALIAVAVSKTRESGSEVGNALKSLFINLQDTTNDSIVEAFDAVGISMTEMVDGTELLKTPIELIKELSEAFNSLPEGDTRRANILSDIAGKYHANTFAAILSDLDSYYDMLELYNSTSAEGSAFDEAEKSANNLSGTLNKISNTWTEIVNNIINADELTVLANGLNNILKIVELLTDKLGLLGTAGVTIGGILGKMGHGLTNYVTQS